MRLRRFTLTLPLAASLLAAPVLQRVLTAQSSPPAQARTLTDPRYELTVSLDPDRHHLSGSGTLRLPGSPAERQEIRLGLSARYGAFSVEVVSPASAAGPADVVVFDSTPPNRRYRVIPRRPIPANVEPELRLTYSGGEGTEWVYYLGPEGSFAAGSMTPWYPQVLAGEGTLRATGTVTFSVPGPYEVVASGDRRSAHRAGRDTTVRHEVQYRFDRPSFFSFAAGRYLVRRREGRIPILAYVLRDRPSLGQYLDRTAEVISTLELEFGAYPFSEFALVEAPADQARRARFNGASLEGFILASSTLIDAPYNTAFYAHEITHQWWGVTLTPRGYAPLLSEMVSQYGALRVVERLEGQDLAARFRRIGYPGYPSDQSARGFLKLAAAGLDSALEAHTHDVTVAQQLSWGKGMLALDQLARTTGYPAFTRALRRLSAEYAFRDVTWHDVLRVVREETAPERRPALDTARAHWFQRTGAPEFALEWRRDGAVIRGTINQTAPHYETTIEIVPVGQGCSGTPHEVRVRGAATSFEIRRPGCTADSVALDPYYRTLRWTPELRAAALSLAGVTRAELLRRQGQLQAAREQYERVLAEGVPVPDRYFVRYFAENGLARVLLSLEDRDGARAHFQAALMAASRPPDGTASVLFELARIAHAAGDHGALRRYVDEVITAESLSGNPSGLAGPARALLQSVGSP